MSTEVAERPLRPLTHAERGALSSGNRKYTPAQIEKGLHVLAMLGNSTKASEATGIPTSTLTFWRREQHAERYQEIRATVMPQVHAQIASESEDLAREYADLERDLVTKFRAELDNLRPSDLAGAVRNLTTSRAISIDKAALLRGQPTERVRHDVDESVRALVSLGVVQIVNSTAEEMHEAQVVDH